MKRLAIRTGDWVVVYPAAPHSMTLPFRRSQNVLPFPPRMPPPVFPGGAE
jgi:hypothetical protein